MLKHQSLLLRRTVNKAFFLTTCPGAPSRSVSDSHAGLFKRGQGLPVKI